MLNKVFYSIRDYNLHTRKEIAEALSVSFVTAAKAVDALINAKIISNAGKTSLGIGRKSDFLDISTDYKILMMSFDRSGFSYSNSRLNGEDMEIIKLPYVDSLDYIDNISFFLSTVKKRMAFTPTKTFVAFPGEIRGGRLVDTYIEDYSGACIDQIFDIHGIKVDGYASFAQSIENSSEFMQTDLVINIGDNVWGEFGREKMENWNSVPIDTKSGMTIKDALQLGCSMKKLCGYIHGILEIADKMIMPNRILLSCDIIDEDSKRFIQAEMGKLKMINIDEVIFDGVLRIANDEILKEICTKN